MVGFDKTVPFYFVYFCGVAMYKNFYKYSNNYNSKYISILRTLSPWAENIGADADNGRSLGNGCFHIGGHAH